MQIIEITGLGVRSAVITMHRNDTTLRFILFPMMHVASPSFYARVRRRLSECDLIVAEGVRGKSRQLSAITLAYRFAPRWRRNGLEVQQTASLLPAGIPVVNPDVTAAEAVADLRRLPRWMYLMLLLAAPVMGVVFAVRGPRAFLRADQPAVGAPAPQSASFPSDSVPDGLQTASAYAPGGMAFTLTGRQCAGAASVAEDGEPFREPNVVADPPRGRLRSPPGTRRASRQQPCRNPWFPHGASGTARSALAFRAGEGIIADRTPTMLTSMIGMTNAGIFRR